MGLRSWYRRRKPTNDAGSTALSVARQPEEQDPPTPAQRADLKDAWTELAEAANASAVTGFHACSRGGKPWQEDPVAVRNMAALIRDVGTADARPEGTPAS
jgi:hypothetical protein